MGKNKLFGSKVLCQDCLSVKDFTAERHNEDELCECGGAFCGCAGCNDYIEQSHLEKSHAGVMGRIIELWSDADSFGGWNDLRDYCFYISQEYANNDRFEAAQELIFLQAIAFERQDFFYRSNMEAA